MTLVLPIETLAIAVLVTFIAAAVQGTIGLGFAVLSVPILSLVEPRLAPVPQVLLALFLSSSMAYRERSAIDPKGVLWVLIGRFPGAALGAALLLLASRRTIDILVACIVLVATGVLSRKTEFGPEQPAPPHRLAEIAAGIASGVGGMVSSIGGPPLALLYRNRAPDEIRANLATIFFLGGLITIGGRIAASKISIEDALIAAYMLPGLFGGLLLSRFLKARVPRPLMRTCVLVAAAVAGLILLVRSLA